MNRNFALVVVLLSLANASVRADVPDPAILFPASTLAYVEIHNPSELGPQLAAVFKGSSLEDSLRLVHDRRDKTKNMRDLMATDEFGILGLLTGPEMIGEFRKLRGAACAITGFNERQEPEIAAALLTGESQVVGMAMRAFLTVNPHVRKIGMASGVPVFQARTAFVNYGPNGQPLPANEKPVEEGFGQPTFAYTPGLIVVGSSRAAVADVIARFQGAGKASLREASHFKEAAAANRKTGLFWFVAAKDLSVKLDAVNKERGDFVDPDVLAFLKMVANVKAIRVASGCVCFRDQGVSVRADFALEPGFTSPLFSVLGGEAADVNSLKYLPAGTTFAIGTALPEANRAAAVLEFLDALAKASGTLGRMPSQAEKEIREKFNVAIAETLLAGTRNAVVAFPARQELPQGAVSLPVLVLHTDNAGTAGQWANGLRALVADFAAADRLPDPASEMVAGVKVYSLPAIGLPSKAPVHYAAEGTVFAVGLDRKLVASAVRPAPPAGLAKIDTKGVAALGMFSPGELAKTMLRKSSKSNPDGEGELPKVAEGPARGRFNGRFRGETQNPPVDPETIKQEAKAYDEWMDALGTAPPAFGTIRRTPKELQTEWFFPEVQGGATTKLIDKAVAWLDRMSAVSSQDNDSQQGFIFKR